MVFFTNEMRHQLNSKLESWRKTLESNGLKVSRSKIEFMECSFSKTWDREGNLIKLGNVRVVHWVKFRYLESIIELRKLDLDIDS